MAVLEVKSENINYTLIEAINILGIDNSKIHLTKEEFEEIHKLYMGELKDYKKSLLFNIKGMGKTIEIYKELNEWEKAIIEEKIFIERNKYSNLLYYQTMVLAKRIKLDINVLNAYYKLPNLLLNKEKELILSALDSIGYNSKSDTTLISFNKLKFYYGKGLDLITEDDFYNFYDEVKNIKPFKVFTILKYLGNIPESSVFESLVKRKRIYPVDYIETSKIDIEKLYYEFKNYTYNTEYKATAFKKVSIAKRFIEWLSSNYDSLENLNELEYKHIDEFILEIKRRKTETNKEYSADTINGELSRFKQGILMYLFINNILSRELIKNIFSDDSMYDELYYKKTKSLPIPVSLSDRKSIENAILKDYENIDKQIMDIIRVCYFLGSRPSEILCLKVNSIKGVREAPSIYIHRTKGFEERYVPLVDDVYKIVKYWQDINKESLAVYLDYDEETAKRLFQKLGKVYDLATIERNFSDIMVLNGIIDYDDLPKYTLYILRKIRITTWLENGLSEEEVAYLVGHDSVDSHNAYIVSKELRKKNAKKVYTQLYKEVFEPTNSKEDLREHDENTNSDKELDDFLNILKEIENKNLNIVMKENIIKEFNELVLPMPCGSCVAKAYDHEFECEMMDIPCLECDELLIEKDNIEVFNEFVKRLFISRNNKIKNGLDGLVMKADFQIRRFKEFYINRLMINKDEVDLLFITLENSVKIKRGRPKKGDI